MGLFIVGDRVIIGRKIYYNHYKFYEVCVMYIISGCSRSGTSLNSIILAKALGEDRFLGKKNFSDKIKPIVDDEYMSYINYLITKEKKGRQADMNPDGFYEMAWSVRGISYSMGLHDVYKEIKKTPIKAAKVVSQGLSKTDPELVTKVIYCLRHPRNVAKSQEKLSGLFPLDIAPIKDGKRVVKHSPQMFVKVSYIAAKWFIKNPDIPVHIVEFSELIERPKEIINGIAEFIDDGDFSDCHELVKAEYNRSDQDEEKEHDMWDMAENIYDAIYTKDWKRVITVHDLGMKKLKEKNKQGEDVFCVRLGRKVTDTNCKFCQTDQVTLNNYKKQNTDWENKPCLRDVLDGKCTIEQSIRNNTWSDPNDDKYPDEDIINE
jgi:hypothetical protein